MSESQYVPAHNIQTSHVARTYSKYHSPAICICFDSHILAWFLPRDALGLGITCRLSVFLSVTLVECDHVGWNSSKIISPSVSLGCSLSADQNISGLLQGEHRKIWAQSDPPPVDLSVGDIRS